MNSTGGVGGTRRSRDQANAGTTGQLGIGISHVRRGAFMARGYHPDGISVLIEPVEQRDVALSRDTENGINPLDPKLIGKDMATDSAFEILFHNQCLTRTSEGRRLKTMTLHPVSLGLDKCSLFTSEKTPPLRRLSLIDTV